jgi:hypothetical protein
MNEHILGSGSRADAVRFPPVREGSIIILLLVVLLVIIQVLDAFCAVGTIFTLGEKVSAGNYCTCSDEDES